MLSEKRIKERIIKPSDSILHALKIMDKIGVKSLLVIDQGTNYFKGVLSIGDIQRAIINNISMQNSISGILRHNPRVSFVNSSVEQIKSEMIRFRMEFMPVVDEHQKVIRIYFWEDLFGEKSYLPIKQFQLPVVIMAGGLGTRLRPFTNVLPKPLFPLSERTIIEEIIDRFKKHGCKEFYISVNYKAELIEYYLKSLELDCNLHYFKENIPLGTAGSLHMLKDQIKGTFFVTNCDIVIEQDYSEILDYHLTNKNEFTIVAVLKHLPIPYGTLDTGKNGKLLNLTEKPEIIFKINSGMYIMESHLLKEIPKNQLFHITTLIENIKAKNAKIGVFPVSSGFWLDIGNWKELIDFYKNDAKR